MSKNIRTKKNKPVSGTREWAAHSVNIQQHCENDCRYCYAKASAIRFHRATFDSWKNPVLNMKAVNTKRRKLDGTIMFPTTHDITPFNLLPSIGVLKSLLKVGNNVLVVSKPRIECVKAICSSLDGFQDQLLFRFTIGSANDKVLGFWEPNASKFDERIECLKYAKNNGWKTSVSCEPMLDNHIGDVIEATRDFVTDAIWLGKPNKLLLRAAFNTCDDGETLKASRALLEIFTDEFVLDLYRQYKDDPMIKWKDSIKQVVGLERPTIKGMDV